MAIPVKFEQANVTFAKDQPEYLPLPAYRDADGCVTTCWKLTWKERLYVLLAGKVWWQTLTFNSPLQPQKPVIRTPFLN